jgi:hypothetical protein
MSFVIGIKQGDGQPTETFGPYATVDECAKALPEILNDMTFDNGNGESVTGLTKFLDEPDEDAPKTDEDYMNMFPRGDVNNNWEVEHVSAQELIDHFKKTRKYNPESWIKITMREMKKV